MLKIDINLEENKIYLISKKKLEDLRINIYSWNPYNNQEVIIYSILNSIHNDIYYWYLPDVIMNNEYGISVKILQNEILLKEEKFRLKTKYGEIIKKQAVIIHADSGLGDHLFCTPIIKKLYQIYKRKITLYTYFPEFFINNPYIENVIKIYNIENLNININEYETHHIAHILSKSFDIIDQHFPDIINLYAHQISLNLQNNEKKIEFFPDDCEIPHSIPENYIVVNPNETRGPRTWGSENYNKLIKMLEDYKIYVVALGKDIDYEDDSKGALKNININYGLNLINKTTLSQAWHIINNSNGFISHSSGLFHLAMSTNAKIYELSANTPFSTWITDGDKNIQIEGECKLHCDSNYEVCVSANGTINKYFFPQCYHEFTKFICHPTPEQVFETIKSDFIIIPEINTRFDNHSTFVEINGNNINKIYNVKFIDKNIILYETNITEDSWAICNYRSSEIKIFDENNHLIFERLNNSIYKDIDLSLTLTFEVLNKYKTSTFIETGTNNGGGCRVALECGFTDIRSVELSDEYNSEIQDLKNNNMVKLYVGKSTEQLSIMLSDINHKCTFWLDAHSYGNCPVLQELIEISKHNIKDHIIMIDDMRSFGTPAHENITQQQIKDTILSINPNYKFRYEASIYDKNDILVAFVSNKIIHCIGDSHTDIFNTITNCKTYEISQPTASHIKNRLDSIDKIVENINIDDYILFSAGEIDCRVFFETRLKYYEDCGLSVEDIEKNKNELIIKIVNNYFNILSERYSKYNLIFWGPVASYREDLIFYTEKIKAQHDESVSFEEVKKRNWLFALQYPNPDLYMPGNHTCVQRNQVSKIFNDELKRLCDENNKIFLTMFYDMLDENMLTKYEMTDGIIHLNETTIPLITNKLKEKNII